MLTNGSAAQILLTFSDLEMDKKLLARVADLSTKKPIIMTMPATLYSINLFKN